jgi:hypothetical protein
MHSLTRTFLSVALALLIGGCAGLPSGDAEAAR